MEQIILDYRSVAPPKTRPGGFSDIYLFDGINLSKWIQEGIDDGSFTFNGVAAYTLLPANVVITSVNTAVNHYSIMDFSTSIVNAGIYEVEVVLMVNKSVAADLWAIGFDLLPNLASGYGRSLIWNNAGTPKYSDATDNTGIPAIQFINPSFPTTNQFTSSSGVFNFMLTVPTTTTFTPNLRYQAATSGNTFTILKSGSYIRFTKISNVS